MRAPSSCSMTAATPSTPRRRPPTCCHSGRNRAYSRGATGSTSLRRAASDRRRMRRSTSLSHHSAPAPCGRNSPSTTRRSPARRPSAEAAMTWPMPNRAATACAVNGPCVRAKRLTRSPSGSRTGSPNTSGRPGGIGTPSASRSRLRSSTAANHAVPANRTSRDASRVGERGERRRGIRGLVCALRDLLGREGPELAEQVGDALLAARGALGHESLQHPLGLFHNLGVEELAELDRAEQLGQQRRVERQRRRATLGERRVALVHEGADVAEEQARGERTRGLGGDLDEPHLARADAFGETGEGGQVVDVLEALAHRFEHDREVGEVARDLEQLRGSLALLPERRPTARVEARQQQRPRRALAEAR